MGKIAFGSIIMSGGTKGDRGPVPVFGDATISMLPVGSSPTVTVTGSGTTADPYDIDFEIPYGTVTPATSSTIGGVKPDGTTTTVDANGVISAASGSSTQQYAGNPNGVLAAASSPSLCIDTTNNLLYYSLTAGSTVWVAVNSVWG